LSESKLSGPCGRVAVCCGGRQKAT